MRPYESRDRILPKTGMDYRSKIKTRSQLVELVARDRAAGKTMEEVLCALVVHSDLIEFVSQRSYASNLSWEYFTTWIALAVNLSWSLALSCWYLADRPFRRYNMPIGDRREWTIV